MSHATSASTNLAPQRGPSVWDKQTDTTTRWHLMTASAGALLATQAWRTSGPRRFWLAGLGAGTIAFALLSVPFGRRVEARLMRSKGRRLVETTDELDRGLKDSFPASDPPAASSTPR